MKRRGVLRLAAATGVPSVAGCLGTDLADPGGETDDSDSGGASETGADDLRVADLLLPAEALPHDGWAEDAPPVGGPVDYRNEGLNVVVRSAATLWASADDARAAFENRRERAESASDDVEDVDVAPRSIVYEPDGTIRAGALYEANALGELRLFRLDPGAEADADRIDVTDLLAATYDAWPF